MSDAAVPVPIRFGPDGLVPVTVQDAVSGDVLMLAFMNEEALAATRATGRAHYWSRTRSRLWAKGETSGYVQAVEAIFVNCERNSLLLSVRQTGAVCHDGYPTCYYRRLEADNSLSVVAERHFDPAVVYGDAEARGVSDDAALVAASRLLYGAYSYLRDEDLSAVSTTSARLQTGEEPLEGRIADELDELAGVLDGSHGHAGPRDDLVLEGSQVVYWATLAAVRAGVTWSRLRPDRALASAEPEGDAGTIARLLRADAERWRPPPDGAADESVLAARCHATLALVGLACAAAEVAPVELLRHDLRSLRVRPYLAEYFAAASV